MDSQKQADNMVAASVKQVVLSNGTAVDLRRVTLRTIKPILKYAEALTTSLQLVVVKNEGVMSSVSLLNFSSPSEVLNLIANNLDGLVELIPLMTSLNAEQVDDLELDDALTICTALLEINSDFFTEKVLPMLERAALPMEGASETVA